MANALRGQVDVKLGNKVYTLKPTFNVLATLESELNRSIFAIITDLSNPRSSKVSDVAKVIHIASGANGKLSDVGEELMGSGATTVLKDVFDFLTRALASDEDLKAAREKAETEVVAAVNP